MTDAAAQRRSRYKPTAQVYQKVCPPGKYHAGGKAGATLCVEGKVSHQWVQRISVKQRRYEISFGSPPVFPLAKARQSVADNRRLVNHGRATLPIETGAARLN